MHLLESFFPCSCFQHSLSCRCIQILKEIWEDENISLLKSPKEEQNNIVTIEKQEEVQVSAL